VTKVCIANNVLSKTIIIACSSAQINILLITISLLDIKKLIAFSTLIQLGLCTTTLFVCGLILIRKSIDFKYQVRVFSCRQIRCMRSI
jgi:NADH:ubiquinone oxidoreductase subunit 5 (subunit L)/multisubunit Na+/H+ antiporter MnhA subunit